MVQIYDQATDGRRAMATYRADRDLSRRVPLRDAITVAVAAGIGYGFDAYAVNLYGLLLPSTAAFLYFNPGIVGIAGSIFLVGYTLGTIILGIAADRFGRLIEDRISNC